jgi:DNA-directed RNA polymerase I, II, and III subunit RPABC2
MEDEDYINEEEYDNEFYEDLEEDMEEDLEEDIEGELEEEQVEEELSLESEIKITSKYLSKYEKTRILGIRAVQISSGSPPLIDVKDETDSLKIAEMELQEKKIPIILRRYLPNGKYEDWKVSELELID